jgi:hypothetical protein
VEPPSYAALKRSRGRLPLRATSSTGQACQQRFRVREPAREYGRCPARTGDLLLVRREQLLPSAAACGLRPPRSDGLAPICCLLLRFAASKPLPDNRFCFHGRRRGRCHAHGFGGAGLVVSATRGEHRGERERDLPHGEPHRCRERVVGAASEACHLWLLGSGSRRACAGPVALGPRGGSAGRAGRLYRSRHRCYGRFRRAREKWTSASLARSRSQITGVSP